jgi:hypothetical protein
MNEKLLQHIWQFQLFNKNDLITSAGEPLQIVHAGAFNHHQGPDFTAAKIRLANTLWVGSVEIHLKATDWFRHRHENDLNYAHIILHVVWEEDQILYDHLNNRIPVLVLQQRVPGQLFHRYQQLLENQAIILCNRFLPALNPLSWMAWKERLVAERWERKAAQIMLWHQQTKGSWEEVCWRMLCENFGMRVNAALFQSVARTLPWQMLARHSQHPLQVEAILMGQANLLGNTFIDAYPLALQQEFRFLRNKYSLPAIMVQPAFLRMRPAGFPTIRLAQLASLCINTPQLFASIKAANHLNSLRNLFMISASAYWNTHYRFDELSKYQPKNLGSRMVENIIINTILPLLYAYGLYTKNEQYTQFALQCLYQLPPENNKVTRVWQDKSISIAHALDAQALIELTNHYCIQKRCLSCAVGNKILATSV